VTDGATGNLKVLRLLKDPKWDGKAYLCTSVCRKSLRCYILLLHDTGDCTDLHLFKGIFGVVHMGIWQGGSSYIESHHIHAGRS